MPADGPRSIVIEQGHPYIEDYTYKDEDDNPISLANYTVVWRVAQWRGTYAPIFLVASSPDNGILKEPGAETGKFRIQVMGDQTSLVYRDCVFEIYLVNISDASDTIPLIYGDAEVRRKPGSGA